MATFNGPFEICLLQNMVPTVCTKSTMHEQSMKLYSIASCLFHVAFCHVVPGLQVIHCTVPNCRINKYRHKSIFDFFP